AGGGAGGARACPDQSRHRGRGPRHHRGLSQAVVVNRLGFLIARTLRNETALQSLSVPQSDLLAALKDKHVALVGNARALAQTGHGKRIDNADLVIRINRAPMPAAASHGTRTDWLALATRLPDADRDRIAPARILWMSPKRKRLDWQTATSPG